MLFFILKFPVLLFDRVPLHMVLETLSYFVGFRYFVYLRSKQGDNIDQSNRLWILIGATFGALLGTRILGLLEAGPKLFTVEKPLEVWLLALFSSKTIVGGLLGGLLGVEGIKKIIGEKSSSGDLFTYPLILAMMIGRFGCFSMGVFEPTYGVETTFFTGMDLGDGLLRHPVALYEVLYLGLFWIVIHNFEKVYPSGFWCSVQNFYAGLSVLSLFTGFHQTRGALALGIECHSNGGRVGLAVLLAIFV